jgi:hypothetical protein
MAATSTSVLTLTIVAAGTIVAARFVTPAGVQAGADANALGVARTAAGSGDKIPLDALGVAIVEAGAAVTTGATVKSDASGRAITWASSGARLGVALTAAGAAGDMIEVHLIPNAA